MFDVISDVEHYTEFLPWCEQSAVKSRTSTQIVSDLTIGMMPVTESYTSIVTMKRPFVIRAGNDGKSTSVNYQLYFCIYELVILDLHRICS